MVLSKWHERAISIWHPMVLFHDWVVSIWYPIVLFHDQILTTALSRRRVRQGVGLTHRILVDQPMTNGKKYEFQAVRDSQLVKNVSEVMLGSVLTDA